MGKNLELFLGKRTDDEFVGVRAGVVNWAEEKSKGIEIGLANVVNEGSNYGLRIGLANCGNENYGVDVGVFNLGGEASGLKVGIANVGDEGTGLNLGLFNVYDEKFSGARIGAINGYMEGSGDFEGVQVGLCNFSEDGQSGVSLGVGNKTRYGRGIQGGGINTASVEFNGLQIGLVNYALNGNYLQIGLLNFGGKRDSVRFFPFIRWHRAISGAVDSD